MTYRLWRSRGVPMRNPGLWGARLRLWPSETIRLSKAYLFSWMVAMRTESVLIIGDVLSSWVILLDVNDQVTPPAGVRAEFGNDVVASFPRTVLAVPIEAEVFVCPEVARNL